MHIERKNISGLIPLVFHSIVEAKDLNEWEDIELDKFKKIISRIMKSSSEEYPKFNSKSLGSKWLITFDDGIKSDFEFVYPLLKKEGLVGIFFIATSFVDTPGYLTWKQIKEMSDNGMLFGSHSHNHRDMTKLSIADLRKEIEISKELLEKYTGKEINAFSFPYGSFTDDLYRIISELGFKFIFNSRHGIASKEGIIPRNSFNYSMSDKEIFKTLEPTIFKRAIWSIEDKLKIFIKKLLGQDQYKIFRNKLALIKQRGKK